MLSTNAHETFWDVRLISTLRTQDLDLGLIMTNEIWMLTYNSGIFSTKLMVAYFYGMMLLMILVNIGFGLSEQWYARQQSWQNFTLATMYNCKIFAVIVSITTICSYSNFSHSIWQRPAPKQLRARLTRTLSNSGARQNRQVLPGWAECSERERRKTSFGEFSERTNNQ